MRQQRSWIISSRHMAFLPWALILSFALPAARATIYRVDLNAPGPARNGLSWSEAFLTVTDAMAVAVSGDEIWVAKGIYANRLQVKSGVSLYGGFAATETDRTERDSVANQTVLNGEHKGTVVTFAQGSGQTTVLDGFTIVNGSGTDYGNSLRGGGIVCDGASPTISNNVIRNNTLAHSAGGNAGAGLYLYSSSARVESNTFTSNSITSIGAEDTFGGAVCCVSFSGWIHANTFNSNIAEYGAGIDCEASPSGRITENTFTANRAAYGGGARFLDANATFEGNILRSNVAPLGGGVCCVGSSNGRFVHNIFENNDASYANANSGGGGGILAYACSPRIECNVFWRNKANYGAGIYVWQGSTSKIISNLIASNTAKLEGGAVECDNASPLLTNNTMAGNTAPTGAIWMANGGQTTLVNNIVAYNTSGLWKNAAMTVVMRNNDVFGNTAYDYQGMTDQTGIAGNIKEDPLFVDRAAKDYHLQATSPCVDAGDNSAVVSAAEDVEGSPRITGEHVDMGAYEFTSIAPFTLADVADALNIPSGRSEATATQVTRLNVALTGTSGSCIDMDDCALIARKAAGLAPNP